MAIGRKTKKSESCRKQLSSFQFVLKMLEIARPGGDCPRATLMTPRR